MKISDNTISILRNFSDINANILFKPGKQLSTVSTMKNIMAEANVEDEFETEFGVYDLPEFLRALDSFTQPVLNFNGSANLKIQDEKTSLSARYAFADKSTLRYPSKSITMPEATDHARAVSRLKLLELAAVDYARDHLPNIQR